MLRTQFAGLVRWSKYIFLAIFFMFTCKYPKPKSELATSLKFARLDYEDFLQRPELEKKKADTNSGKFDHGVNQGNWI